MYKKTSMTASLVMAFLLLSTSIATVVAREPSRIVFGGIARGQGLMMWGGGLYPDYPFGDSEYSSILNTESCFIIVGKALLEEIDIDWLQGDYELEAWKLREIESWASMSAKWTNGEEEYNLQVEFEIEEEVDSIYATGLSGSGSDPSTYSFIEGLMVGINLASEDPFPRPWDHIELGKRWDPKFATMTFEGTHNDEEIEGTAIVLFAYLPEYKGGFVFVNLWIEEEIYAAFVWFPGELQRVRFYSKLI